jgi:hypothetical protein
MAYLGRQNRGRKKTVNPARLRQLARMRKVRLDRLVQYLSCATTFLSLTPAFRPVSRPLRTQSRFNGFFPLSNAARGAR